MYETWLEVRIDTVSPCLDDVAAYLTARGIVGLVIEDENDLEQFEDEQQACWSEIDEEFKDSFKGLSRVKFYVTDDEDGHARLEEVKAGLPAFRDRVGKDCGSLAVSTVSLREEDWAHNWQKYYQPFPVGEKLYVVPEWMREMEVPEGRTAMILNPGLIFGTGSHGTTRLCLEGVERFAKEGDRVLDLGTGSGILSIAAILLGASEAVGCDIDPKASRVAAENASYNGISSQFRVETGDVIGDDGLREKLAGCYDLVLANIIPDVIIPLIPYVKEFLAPGGKFLTSGIIEHRAEDVVNTLKENGYTILERHDREGWVAYITQRS